MAEFMNQAILEQRRSHGDPQGQALAQAAQGIRAQAQLNLQRQQADAAQQQREMNQGLTVLDLDWVPIDEKVRVANQLGKRFGIQGEITADGLQPYRQLLTDMGKDFDEGKDLSRWAQAVELFSANPKFVDPSKRQMVIQAQQQLQEQKVQQVASAQVPSVEGGPEAMGRTQEARGRLALFDSITPDDPEAAQKMESFTKVYGSAERLQQQIEADRLVVADEEQRLKEREQYASALRMAPAELAKQAALGLDPKTMLLPLISRAIQEKGIEGLDQQDRNRLDAFYTINGQPEKLAVFSETGKVNQLKQYQQDLIDVKSTLGAIDQVKQVMQTGKERIGAYDAATSDMLDELATASTSLPAEQYEKRQAALTQLKTATEAVAQDWEATIEPVRNELTNGARAAHQTVAQLDAQMRRPGVDRITLAKRKEQAQQQADTYESMNKILGLSSDLDVSLKRNALKAVEIDAKTGETEEARRTAAALIPKLKQELSTLEQDVAKNAAQMELHRERLARQAKITQLRITAGDKKLEQAQQNGVMASAFLSEWAASGFKTNADKWYTQNATFFDGADPKLFMDVVKPALESRKELSLGQAERELLATGDPKQAGPIAAKYGVKPSDILGVLKDPTQAPMQVTMKQESAESQTVGKGFGEQFIKTQEAGVAASGKIAKIDRMEQLLVGVQTGALIPSLTQIQNVANSLGFKVDPSLPAKQALESLSNEMALQLRNPAGGAGMPGALSDKDREFLVSMTPGLSKTPEGNAMILSTAKQLAKRDQDVARLAREYRKKHGHLDEGFYDELQAFSDKNPLFPAAQAAATIPTIKDDAEYNRLPPGTDYIGPDGKKRKKK